MIISLCGFMGAGKSTIGKYLARYIGYNFIDLDIYLEAKFKTSVSAFFEKNGEAAFREEEFNALTELVNKEYTKGLVLALGGGTVTTEKCSKIIKESTICVYLNCPKEILINRLIKNNSKRPLIAGKSKEEMEQFINEITIKREPLYKECSQYIFNILPHETLTQIIERMVSSTPKEYLK